MTTFSRTWNATYQSLPEDDDDALEGASHIRNTRIDVKERMEVDHFWAGDGHDGKHKKLTLRPIAADPALEADEVALYGKAVGTKTELFFRNEDGNVIQMTFTGISQFLPAGVVVPYAGTVAPSGFVFCFGQSLQVSQYPALFAAIGATFGGDGVNTFFVPDLRGRTIAGKDDMGGVSANRLTSPLNGDTLGGAGGSEGVALTTAGQLAPHTHGVNDPQHRHSVQIVGRDGTAGASQDGAWDQGSINSGFASTGITIQSTGASDPHPNVQPTMILNYIIKT